MEIYVKISSISIFSLFCCFQSWFYYIHWFCPYRSFKRINWWRHKL